MLNICITFDYELFFNETSYSEYDVLIEPTDRLTRVLDKYKVKGTYFADISSILRYRELNRTQFPEQAEQQMKELLLNGHDVQLHIHPHWYHSKVINDKWEFDNSHYRIHTFEFGGKQMGQITGESIVKQSVDYLNNLLREVNPDYQCFAFRAGGFCIQPEKELFQALIDNNILIDSSICKGISKDSGIHYYNYMNLPKDINWWISPDDGISNIHREKNNNNMLYEVPIGSVGKRPLKWKLSKMPKVEREPYKGKHTPASLIKESKLKKYMKLVQNIWSQSLIFTLDSYHYKTLLKFIEYYVKKYDTENTDYYLSVICHPKFTCDSLIENMDHFIESSMEKYKSVRFINMSDVKSRL